MSEAGGFVAGAVVTLGTTRYAVDIRAGHHALVADEPKSAGGGDAGRASAMRPAWRRL